jgi:hypothetical protein
MNTPSRYGTDAAHERTSLARACSAACQRLYLQEVRLTYRPPPTKGRWLAVGIIAPGYIVAEGCGRWAEEAVAALTPTTRVGQ